jgi:CRP/FNR family transcriptional regulator, cyclic AMP receptor protein
MQNMDNKIQPLKIYQYFGSLKPSSREKLAALLTLQVFVKDKIIFRQGEAGNCLYIIQTGKVKICSFAPDGGELIFGFFSAGDLLGEMAVIDGGPRSTTAITVENTDTLVLKRQAFLRFLHSVPEASLGVINLLCRRLRDTNRQLEEATSLDVSARLARKLIEISPCRESQEELGRIIGASRVMVNRVLNSWMSQGLITISRKNITINNLRELKRAARYEQ